MKFIHNIVLQVDGPKKADFLAAGVDLAEGFTTLKIEETDPRWNVVSLLVDKYRLVDSVTTKFTTSELDASESLAVIPTWHHGFPQPEEDWGYLKATFDLADHCQECGIGKRQAAPFRMTKAPTWGSKSILQLNWVFDEYFVKPDVWASIFKPFGVGCAPVLRHQTGLPLDSVVQLVIDKMSKLNLDGFSFEKCPSCGCKKYLPVTRGLYPGPVSPDGAIFKSTQFFGSGGRAHKQVFMSNLLYRKVGEAGLKGVAFKACEPDHL